MANIQTDDLEIEKELASGGYGVVYRGRWKKENIPVAVKKLFKTDANEISILKQLQHPNIVTLYGFVHDKMDSKIVMELCELGSLRSFLEQRKNIPLSSSLIFDWMLQASYPIDYLRNRKIEHMDIKTDNYVINSNMVLKLTDFGLSRFLERTQSCSSEAGSWRWMSPERLRDHKLSPKFSIYALALVFWSLFTRVLPYADFPSEFSVMKAVCDDKIRPSLPADCPKRIGDLIEACWDDDRAKRPDINNVIMILVLCKSVYEVTATEVSTQTEVCKLKTKLTQTKVCKLKTTRTQTPYLKYVDASTQSDMVLTETQAISNQKDTGGTGESEYMNDTFRSDTDPNSTNSLIQHLRPISKGFQDIAKNIPKKLIGDKSPLSKLNEQYVDDLLQDAHRRPTVTPIVKAFEKREATQRISTSADFRTSKGIEIVIENYDITKARVDIIVNVTNKHLTLEGGNADALLKAAGKELQHDCDRIMKNRPQLRVGECLVTGGYKLNCKILHTVGPIYRERSSDEEFCQSLKDTFLAAIRYANLSVEAKSIAIHLVSSDYGEPEYTHAISLLNAIEEFNMEPHHVIKTIFIIHPDTGATQTLPVYRVFAERYSIKRPSIIATGDTTTRRTVSIFKGTCDSHLPAKQDMMIQYIDDASVHGAIPKPIPRATVNQEFRETGCTQDMSWAAKHVVRLRKPLFPFERKPSTKHAKEEKKPKTLRCGKCAVEEDLQRLGGCGHTFCGGCIRKSVVPSAKCTICRALYHLVYGDEVYAGCMAMYSRTNLSLPGEKEHGLIEIIYVLPDGMVMERRTERRYRGNQFVAYLPNTANGTEIAWLFKKAFVRNLTFEVKDRKGSLEVTWSNLIPHKTQIRGGVNNNGYPDPGYLPRVKNKLRKCKIVSNLPAKKSSPAK